MMNSNQPRSRPGIVLVIVLGMLSLFSVLIVSYVIFSSQAVSISAADQARTEDNFPTRGTLQRGMSSLIYGSTNHKSAAYGHSLLDDLYGNDGITMRVGGRRFGAAAPLTMPVVSTGIDSRGLLLRDGTPSGDPLLLFKFPTSVAAWHDEGLPVPQPATENVINNVPVEFPNLPFALDDTFAGRQVTFIEGPLANQTFQIVRSFGSDNATAPADTDLVESYLAGNFVIDLAQLPIQEVLIDEVSVNVVQIARQRPNRLLYSAGDDQGPGRAGVNDDGDGLTDEPDELGFPGTDDVGYRFVVNGVAFNGAGRNPLATRGLYRNLTATPSSLYDDNTHAELQVNGALMPPDVFVSPAETSPLRRQPQPDEPWDAADIENMFLAWQPSDHRRGDPRNVIYTGGNATELNNNLGSQIIPSFHRPALVNYLFGSPIYIINEDPATAPVPPNFWQLPVTGGGADDRDRMQVFVNRLRRAVMRPLNFERGVGPTQVDLDVDGFDDGTPGFTGSNSVPILAETIPAFVTTANYDQVRRQILDLGVWLANGPWDVDNDGDGLPDSVWVDLQLPTYTTPDGVTVRPLIAPLIEDLDGRININEAGNYQQLTTNLFDATAPISFDDDEDGFYLSAGRSLNLFGRGGGVGPAEIDFSHLFDENGPPITAGFVGPIRHDQTSANLFPLGSSQRFLIDSTRYGNLLNARYGGPISNYSVNRLADIDRHFPGLGTVAAPAVNLDTLARIPSPSRRIGQSAAGVAGKPLDLSGISQETSDRYGNELVDNLAQANQLPILNEVVNQPYETGLPTGGDTPFTIAELVGLISPHGDPGRLGSLLADEVERNPTLSSLITTHSEMLDVPELPDKFGIVDFFSDKLAGTPPEGRQIHLDRMIAPELRKGTKLNLNRALGNGQDSGLNPTLNGVVPTAPALVDETLETEPVDALNLASGTDDPTLVTNRDTRQVAFPQIAGQFPALALVRANYAAMSSLERRNLATANPPADFNGIDTDGDGVVDAGVDVDGDGVTDRAPTGNELLARQLYCLMMALIVDDPNASPLVPNFPYPIDFVNNAGIRDRYVARRVAQWAVNAVDFRDTDAICTRLRYDLNPFDATGFDLAEATQNVVWGMERPELAITETLAFHDKRLRRNLDKEPNATDPNLSLDGQLQDDEDDDPMDAVDPDEDMDQFRIPEASAFVELHSLRSPLTNVGNQPSLPVELYDPITGALDLGRVVGSGRARSPVWRLAVGEAIQGDPNRSIRWLFDADRVGGKIAIDQGRIEEVDYFQPPVSAPGDLVTPLQNWRQLAAVTAEVRDVNGAIVELADDDLVATNASPHRVQLTRFVWFTDLVPDAASLDILSNPLSGMAPTNVFFNRPDPAAPGDMTLPMNAPALLEPGRYAVVAPRVRTILGQLPTAANSEVNPTDFRFDPSPQQINFSLQAVTPVPNPRWFRLNYLDLAGTNRTPLYADSDGNAPFEDYHVEHVLPIIAQSLYPDQVGADPSWGTYRGAVNPDQQVGIGFNISAPLLNNYYAAPTHRISADDTSAAGIQYPRVDGYRDYEAGIGFHPDQPFDHVMGTPMADNGWAAIGTHQEAVGVFLQRLADPTTPWHPVDNPYVTVDLAPIDLTTFNGEGNPIELIDRTAPGATEIADNASQFDGTNFIPRMRFDSRRKIPDTKNDRGLTQLVPTSATQTNDLADHTRAVFAERSALSASFSVLRETPSVGLPFDSPTAPRFNFPLGAMWDGMGAPDDATINASYLVDPTHTPSPTGARFAYHAQMDLPAVPYRQTLGFVNREWGRPIGNRFRANGVGDVAAVAAYGRGSPDSSILRMPQWDDREFRSTYDLMIVPATSRSGILNRFSPGTRLENGGLREIPTPFAHLLGFAFGYADRKVPGAAPEPEDEAPLAGQPLVSGATSGFLQPTPLGDVLVPLGNVAGNRPPFEAIFDLVNTGEIRYADNLWFNPADVKFIPRGNGQPQLSERQRMFNRSVEFLQPPFNYIPSLRKSGRINVNTSPDYIRKGEAIAVFGNEFLDGTEFLNDNTQQGTAIVGFTDTSASLSENVPNDLVTGAPTSLFGNGSIFRSWSWSNSTIYDLDNARGSVFGAGSAPRSVIGQVDLYGNQVDSRYGHGFKSFIESRRGYDQTTASPITGSGLLNPNLDWRYPTQFAGIFAPAMAAKVPTVHRFMRLPDEQDPAIATLRRTHDMGLMRPHPDMDPRTSDDLRTALGNETDTVAYSLNVETDPGMDDLNSVTAPPAVANLRMMRTRTGMLERSLPELHKDLRHRARHPEARFENASRTVNKTTHHSNVFLVRLTVGYFEVDPITDQVVGEYRNPQGARNRGSAAFVVDRSIPVGFLPGRPINHENTIIFSSLAP